MCDDNLQENDTSNPRYSVDETIEGLHQHERVNDNTTKSEDRQQRTNKRGRVEWYTV